MRVSDVFLIPKGDPDRIELIYASEKGYFLLEPWQRKDSPTQLEEDIWYLASVNPKEIRTELKAHLTKLGKDILPQLSLGMPEVELKGNS
jgi:hypothetical protein